jgi:stearoyl-CoA desaturase (delta-9 desaturase)
MFSGVFDLSWLGYVGLTLALTHVTIASVTIFLHRHQAHRALELGAVPSHFFRLWLWLTTGMVTKEWASVHRKHHAKCETVDDPHSPQIYGIHRVLWTGVLLYVDEARNPETLQRYGHGTPDDWVESHVYSAFPKSGIVITLLLNVVLFGAVPGALMWIAQVAWIPFWAAGVINGVGHFWGYRNFACGDASTNIFPIGILIGGEELHNNHHTFATSAKLSNKWYEFDIGWTYIRVLEILHMARVKKIAPTAKLVGARPVIDVETLQAVINHRYDVLARYVRSARQVASEEFARLKLDARESRMMKRLIGQSDGSALAGSAELRERFAQLMDSSERLKQVQAMRAELEALWARSSASHDQLVKQLQDWIVRAEASGIRQLEEFSMSLRRYAV